MEEFRGEMIWIGASGKASFVLQICVLGRGKGGCTQVLFHRPTPLFPHVALISGNLFLLYWNFQYYFPTILYPL